MGGPKTLRHRPLRPSVGDANDLEIRWEFGPVTQRPQTAVGAVPTCRDCASLCNSHDAASERRIVAYVLAVEAIGVAIHGHPDRAARHQRHRRHFVCDIAVVIDLIDRAPVGGLVERRLDETDQRVVRLSFTPRGEQRVAAVAHIEELRRQVRRGARTGIDALVVLCLDVVRVAIAQR